ncbi:YitT family protein [Amaricoccus macauensis]|uniref:YitT family protein n=1 Tax=Amaricoccus macauensis TaxID=57001 RepID=UPI003C7D6487
MAEKPEAAPRHTPLEDAQGLFAGAVMVALGLGLLQHLGLVTGQAAGLALLISKWTGIGFGPVFFVINLPFYWLAIRRMGRAFTVKTFLAICLISILTMVQPQLLQFGEVNPLAGAVVAGIVSGAGLLAIFRHRASLGGIGILAVYLQDRAGFRAGWTQMIVDAVIFVLALFTLDLRAVLLSLIGAVALNLIIAINHRRDRYIAM